VRLIKINLESVRYKNIAAQHLFSYRRPK